MISIFLADEDWNILLLLSNLNNKQGEWQGKYITNFACQSLLSIRSRGSLRVLFVHPFKIFILKCSIQAVGLPWSDPCAYFILALNSLVVEFALLRVLSWLLLIVEFQGRVTLWVMGLWSCCIWVALRGRLGSWVFISLHFHYLVLQNYLLRLSQGDPYLPNLLAQAGVHYKDYFMRPGMDLVYRQTN